MKGQKNMLQMKVQGKKLQYLKNQRKQGTYMKKNYKNDSFKISKTEWRIQETFNTFNKDPDEIKNKQTVTNNTITERKCSRKNK